VNRRGIAVLLPQARFGAPPQLAHARPSRIVGNETCIAVEIRGAVGVSQDEPLDEFLGGRIADRLLCGGRLGRFGLAHQIDGVPYRRKIAGQRRRLRAFRGFGSRLRFMPRGMLVFLTLVLLTLVFLKRSVVVMPCLARRMAFLGVLDLLVAGVR
jgi:hypothetical protein